MDKTEETMQKYLDSMPMGMCSLRRDDKLSIVYANAAFYNIFHCIKNPVDKETCTYSLKEYVDPQDFQMILDYFESGLEKEISFEIKTEDILEPNRKVFFCGGYSDDTKEYWNGAVFEKREEHYEFLFDDKNRKMNVRTFKAEVSRLFQKRNNQKYSLWYSDLKNFNLINDIYNYDIGDKVLAYWTDMIQSDLQKGEIFTRISADYMVVLRKYNNQNELRERFFKISHLLSDFSEKIGGKIRIELVSGIYCIEKEEDILSLEDMIDRANIAKKSIKGKSGSNFAIYTEEMRNQILKEKEMEAKMHHALKNDEFKVYLQPQVAIQDGNRIVGAEALVRWESPTKGLVLPSEFIPIFEQNGFISDLDAFVFQEICSYQLDRIRNGKKPIKISVNVSRYSAFQAGFTDHYITTKQRYKIPSGLLELECTETAIGENVKVLEEVMHTMRVNGFTFSLDDFGSGYSSLNLLKDVTVDVLKLDMMFFSKGISKVRDYSIIESVISMAKKLNMEIVAEGVETKEQLELLREMGCDIVQGYYFGRPLPIKEFEECFLSAEEIK